MKKYLYLTLFTIFSILFLGMNIVSAADEDCCCYVYDVTEAGTYAVSSASTEVFKDTPSNDSCRSQCYTFFTSKDKADKFMIYRDSDEFTKQQCFDDFTAGKNRGEEVDYEQFIGCGIVNGDTSDLKYIDIFGPTGHLFEHLSEDVFDLNDSGYATTKDFSTGLIIEGGEELNFLSSTSMSSLSAFWTNYMNNYFFFEGEAKITEYLGIAYHSKQDPETECSKLYLQQRGEFSRKPQSDTIKLTTSDAPSVEVQKVTLNLGDTSKQVIAGSSFEPDVTGITFEWSNSDDPSWEKSASKIITASGSGNSSGGVFGDTITITPQNTGSTILTVKTDWGGSASVQVVVQGFGMEERVAKIKTYCDSIAGNDGIVQSICDEINVSTSVSQAKNICKDAELYLGIYESDKCNPEASAVTTNANEKNAEGLLKDMQEKIGGVKSLKGTDVAASVLIGSLIKFVLGIIGSLAFVVFVYGGIMYMFSAGDQARVKKGRDVFVWAGIGLLVVFGSYTILNFIIESL